MVILLINRRYIMKKVILSAAMGLAMFSASAEDVVVAAANDAATEAAFDGMYFGLGLGGSFLKAKEDVTIQGVTTRVFDKKSNSFIGSAVFGGGKTFKDKFYVGAETMLDFGKSTIKIGAGKADLRRFVTPELAARIGYVNTNTMFYGKVGAVFAKIGVKNKVLPALGLGVERAFCKKFSARLEGEYVFPAKFDNKIGNDGFKTRAGNGFNVRALVSYNVKI